MPVIYAKAGGKRYRLTVSRSWLIENDNGSMVSTGLTVGTDLRQDQLDTLIRQGKAEEVSSEQYNHSGCQSSCVLRGDPECRW